MYKNNYHEQKGCDVQSSTLFILQKIVINLIKNAERTAIYILYLEFLCGRMVLVNWNILEICS